MALRQAENQAVFGLPLPNPLRRCFKTGVVWAIFRRRVTQGGLRMAELVSDALWKEIEPSTAPAAAAFSQRRSSAGPASRGFGGDRLRAQNGHSLASFADRNELWQRQHLLAAFQRKDAADATFSDTCRVYALRNRIQKRSSDGYGSATRSGMAPAMPRSKR